MPLTTFGYAAAIARLYPRASWGMGSEELDSLVWEGPGERPALAEIVRAAPAAWLDDAKANGKAMVDEQAEAERLAYITNGAGQAMVYTEKLYEARAFDRGLAYPEDCHLLQSMVDAGDIDPMSGGTITNISHAATVVMRTAAQWAQIAASIEVRRLRAKRAIDRAATVPEIEKAMAAEGWTVN